MVEYYDGVQSIRLITSGIIINETLYKVTEVLKDNRIYVVRSVTNIVNAERFFFTADEVYKYETKEDITLFLLTNI